MRPALTAPAPKQPAITRNAAIAVGVVLLHVLVLWALQSGLLRRPVEVLVPVQLLAEWVTPPTHTTPNTVPTRPAPPIAPQQAPYTPKAAPKLPPPPTPAALTNTPAELSAPVGVVTPQPPAPALAAPVAAVAVAAAAGAAQPNPAAHATPTAPRVELPSSNADYLQNPKPVYPPMSKRLGEQGQVIHSVLIGVDGLPISAQLVKSSGSDRLDQAAYNAVMRWRFVPGKRNGVPVAMSFNVPIYWVLE